MLPILNGGLTFDFLQLFTPDRSRRGATFFAKGLCALRQVKFSAKFDGIGLLSLRHVKKVGGLPDE